MFTYCECEALGLTLARAELWPATPSNPRCVFSFALLDRAERLMMEAQVSLKDFCGSLKFQWHSPKFKVTKIKLNVTYSNRRFSSNRYWST